MILILAAVAATIGLAATGTVYGVLAAGLRLRETLVPLLVLPVLAPVMLGATRAFEDGLGGRSGRRVALGALLVIFAVLYTAHRCAGVRTAVGGVMSSPGTVERPGTACSDPRLSRVLGWASIVSLVVLALVRSVGRARGRDAEGSAAAAVPARARRVAGLPRVRRHRARVGAVPLAAHPLDGLGPLAGASAELGVLFTALTLVLGSLWGKPVWGTWWAWDARLTTTAVLFFLYLGYLALRRIPAATRSAARKRSAIAALIAFVDVPIVHFSVTWWQTLHQKATVFNPKLNAKIHGVMAFTLWIGVIAFTILYVYLLDRRYRLARSRKSMEQRELDAAIADRVGAPREPDPERPGGGRLDDALAVELADADYGWVYVVIGWTLDRVVIAAYFVSVAMRIRRAERSLPPELRAVTTTTPRPSRAAPPLHRRQTKRRAASSRRRVRRRGASC